MEHVHTLPRGDFTATLGAVRHGPVLHVTASARDETAEVVRSALERTRGAGVEARWATVTTSGRFEGICEHLASSLRGSPMGAVELGAEEHATYASVLSAGAGLLSEIVRSPAVALLHDPSTAGLCESFKRTGARVVWVCHVGVDETSEFSRRAWNFLLPHLQVADTLLFLRADHAPPHRKGQVVITSSPSASLPLMRGAGAAEVAVASLLASASRTRPSG